MAEFATIDQLLETIQTLGRVTALVNGLRGQTAALTFACGALALRICELEHSHATLESLVDAIETTAAAAASDPTQPKDLAQGMKLVSKSLAAHRAAAQG